MYIGLCWLGENDQFSNKCLYIDIGVYKNCVIIAIVMVHALLLVGLIELTHSTRRKFKVDLGGFFRACGEPGPLF